MKSQRNRMFVLSIGVVMVLLFTMVHSATGAAASRGPWETDLFVSDTSEVQFSTVFGGPTQIPILTSIDVGQKAFVLKYPQPGGDGSCGPGNAWNCWAFYEPEMDTDHVSEVAEHTYVQSFVLSWVWVRADGDVYRYHQEWVETPTDLELLNQGNEMIYRPPDGYSVAGRPSLALDPSGNAHVALITHAAASPFLNSLVYIHWSNSVGADCGLPTTRYKCETIEGHSLLNGGIGAYPKITVNSSYIPGILFYDGYTDFLTYAYPQSNLNYSPNCGPGNNTWRCVQITQSVQSASVFDSDIGLNISQPQFAWSNEDTLNQTWVNHARFVGSGGNCGDDYYRNAFNMIVHGNRWECHQTVEIGIDPYTVSVSIQVDDNNNPVIACNPGDTVSQLGVIYGGPENTYAYQRVESGPINTGKNASLALSTNGRGFIAYIEDEEYSPNLKFALQDLAIYLPLVRR